MSLALNCSAQKIIYCFMADEIKRGRFCLVVGRWRSSLSCINQGGLPNDDPRSSTAIMHSGQYFPASPVGPAHYLSSTARLKGRALQKQRLAKSCITVQRNERGLYGCALRENLLGRFQSSSSSRATESWRRPPVAIAVPFSLPNPGIFKKLCCSMYPKIFMCLFQKGGFCPLGFQGLPASTAGPAGLRATGTNFVPEPGGLCAAMSSPLRGYAQGQHHAGLLQWLLQRNFSCFAAEMLVFFRRGSCCLHLIKAVWN